MKAVIERNAFFKCKNLKTLDLGLDCSRLGEIIIRNNAFNGCSSLDDLQISGYKADHSGLYINSGAFNTTPLLNNSKIIKYVDDKYKLFKGGRKFSGTVFNVVILVDKKGVYENSGNEITNYSRMYLRNYQKITSEARKYDPDIDLEFKTQLVHVIARNDTTTNRDIDITSAVYRSFNYFEETGATPAEYSSINYTKLNEIIKRKYKADHVVYTYIYEYPDTVPAENRIRPKYGSDSIYIYNYHDNNIEDLWYHEIQHFFGGDDYYEEKGTNLESTSKVKINCLDQEYSDDYLYNDVMYGCKLSNRIGWLTAASVGWTDSYLVSDYNSIDWSN